MLKSQTWPVAVVLGHGGAEHVSRRVPLQKALPGSAGHHVTKPLWAPQPCSMPQRGFWFHCFTLAKTGVHTMSYHFYENGIPLLSFFPKFPLSLPKSVLPPGSPGAISESKCISRSSLRAPSHVSIVLESIKGSQDNPARALGRTGN